MGAMTLVVDQRGAKLALVGSGVLVVTYADGTVHRAGLGTLRCVLVHGDCALSASLLRACRDEKVGVLLIPGRGAGAPLHLLPTEPSLARLRHAQHLCYADDVVRLALARRLVAAKIEEQSRLLESHGPAPDLRRFVHTLPDAPDIATLMGIEGAVAAAYFGAWANALPRPWSFPYRNRRPPQDPVNALLSLGYTLALHYVGRYAMCYGLDPAVGFLHGPQRNRPALALDLIEPVRPWVDEWVWQCLKTGALTPERFTISEIEGCRLDKAGREIFYGMWFKNEDTWFSAPTRAALALLLKGLRPYRGSQEEREQD